MVVVDSSPSSAFWRFDCGSEEEVRSEIGRVNTEGDVSCLHVMLAGAVTEEVDGEVS